MKDTRTIAQLLRDGWRVGVAELSTDTLSAAILITFNHDFTYHLVTKEWARSTEGAYEFTGHALYYIDYYEEEAFAVILSSWDSTRPYHEVISESAKTVAEWISLGNTG